MVNPMEIAMREMSRLIDLANVNADTIPEVINANGPTYGAKGDGSDSTAALQKAIDAAQNAGRSEVYLSPGNYVYTTLTNTSGIVFVGDGVTVSGSPAIPVISPAQLNAQLADIAVNVTSFGAKGDGVTDDTDSIQQAIDFCIANKKTLLIPDTGNFFDVQTLYESGIGARKYGLHIHGNLILQCSGKIGSSTATANDILFLLGGMGSTIEFDGVHCTGSNLRFDFVRFVSETPIASVIIKNCKTDRQSIAIMGVVTDNIVIENNEIGATVVEDFANAETDINSPRFDVGQPHATKCRNVSIRNNVLKITHSNNNAGVSTHSLGGETTITGNKVYILSNDLLTGFDLDGLGRNAVVSNNIVHGGGYEYKLGDPSTPTEDVVFSDNISVNAKSIAFSLRSSGLFSNLLAIKPQEDAFYITNDSEHPMKLKNIAGLFDDSNGKYGMRMFGALKNVTVDGLTLKQYDTSKGLKRTFPGVLLNGPCDNIIFNDVYIQGFTSHGLRFTPAIGDSDVSKNLVFRDLLFEDIAGGAILLGYSGEFIDSYENIMIDNLKTRNVSGKAFETSVSVGKVTNRLCITNTDVNITDIVFRDTKNRNNILGLKLNGFGFDFETTTGNQPSTDSYWSVGDMVRVDDGGSVWLRVANTKTSSDWVQVS